MKKLICFFSVLMVATCLFAAGAKWKGSDLYYTKKCDKLIETYNLQRIYAVDNVWVYKNEETGDWAYFMWEGSEENNDKNVFFISFASLGGVFNSCVVLGSFTNFSQNDKYLHSYMDEQTTNLPTTDFLGRSNYAWNNTTYVYYAMFRRRLSAFWEMKAIQDEVEITIPDDVFDRYDYFSQLIVELNDNEDVVIILPKEYKKYLKEHK